MLFSQIQGAKRYLTIGFIFNAFVNVLNFTFPLYMLQIYDRVLASFSMPTLFLLTVFAVLALFVQFLLDLCRSYIMILVGSKVEKGLGMAALVRSIRRKVGNREEQEGSGVFEDVAQVRNGLTTTAIMPVFDLPFMPFYIYVVFLIHPYLGWFMVAGTVIMIFFGVMSYVSTLGPARRAEKERLESTAFSQGLASGLGMINCMGMRDAIFKRWMGMNVNQARTEACNFNRSNTWGAMTKGFRQLIQVGIYGVGAYLAIKQETSAGGIIAASIVGARGLQPAEMAVTAWLQIKMFLASYGRLSKLFGSVDAVERPLVHEPTGEMTLDGVSFGVDGKDILENVSFSLKPGESVGVIGPNSAGKTTLCKVLAGLLDPTAGKVTVDGVDFTRVNKESFGDHVGFLAQDVQLFGGSVADNISRFAEVDSEEVIAAAGMIGMHDHILHLPGGYNYQLMPRGTNLSGGQRQRIGLARAMFGSPRIAILDEPNSNLDDEGDRAFMAMIEKIRGKVTTVIVTHRMNVLSKLDKVLVLKEGKVVMFQDSASFFQSIQQQKQQQAAGAAK